MNTRDASTKAALSAALVALSFLLALQLPSSGFAGAGSSTVGTPLSGGRLLVSVDLENMSAPPAPYRGVQVGISQLVPHGLHLVLPTNGTGEAEFTLLPGAYGVAVGNDKFTLSSDVSVEPGNLTSMQVTVNRTAYTAAFVAAEDSTSQGEIEPWNTVVLEVTPYQFPGLLSLGGVIITGPGPANPSPPTFNGTVFLQTGSFYVSGTFSGLAGGPEVPATVLSQVIRPGGTWLTLRPAGVLQLAGSSFLYVVGYQAKSSVTIESA